MKKLLLLILASLLFFLCACANVSLSYSLTDANEISLDYFVSFDEHEENISAYLDGIGSYWESLGFIVTADAQAQTLKGQALYSFDNAAQAAGEFARQITQNDTVFFDVGFEHTPSFDVDNYRFSAAVSLEDVIRQSKPQNIPANLVSDLVSSASQGTYAVSLSLPGEVVSTNADSVENGVCTWSVPFGEKRQLLLHTQSTNTDNLLLYNSLQNDIAANQTILIICIAVSAVSLLIIVVAVAVRRARLRRSAKVRVKQFR